MAERVMLVLGSARSGTTWLAKILDSHPDVLYRHEPDETFPPDPSLDPHAQVCTWIDARGPRSATKQPFFRKSWQTPGLAALRQTLAMTVNGLSRLPVADAIARGISIPDFIARPQAARVRPTIKLVNWDGTAVLTALPDSRCVFILRHPCGQIASVMKGESQRQFNTGEDGAGRPFSDDDVIAFAGRHGVDRDAYQALSAASRHAWTWLFFNQPMTRVLAKRSNAKVVLYESLCRDPEGLTHDIFDFAGLDWNSQTEGFLSTSTRHAGNAGYYDVFRTSSAAADKWRQTMDPADQAAIRDVVRRFPIADHWPDLRQ